MQAFTARTISVSIARVWRKVYDFASKPENMPRWASGLASSLRQVDGQWLADAPPGLVEVRFAERNAWGVLDHWVVPTEGAEICVDPTVSAQVRLTTW